MNLPRVRSLMVSVLPLSLPLFAACNAPIDESDTGEESMGVAAQAVVTTWPMPNPAGADLPHPAVYTSASGVVSDQVTGLEWQQGIGCSDGCSHADAAAYCESLTLGGHDDWRLPTRIELVSIVDYTKHAPAIHPTAFPDTPSSVFFWTSSPMIFFPDNPNFFRIGSGEGNTTYGGMNGLNRARCVRAPAAAPDSPYVIQANGTVLDNGTGLTWQRAEPEGTSTFTWSEAVSYCVDHSNTSELPGPGWRLPSMKELQTIVDDGHVSPAIDLDAFPSTPVDVAYWTSTAVAWTQQPYAWFVRFKLGQVNHDPVAVANHVRCVNDSGYVCTNGATRSCYTGAAGTEGVGVCHAGVQTCVANQWAACGGEVTPAAESCNGLDDDCDGIVDENATGAPIWYRDADGDGYGDPNVTTPSCSQPAGYVSDHTDCSDSDAAVHLCPSSVSIRRHCSSGQPDDVILQTVAAASCVNLAFIGGSFADLDGAGTVTIYEGSGCTGGKKQISTDTSFCNVDFDNGHPMNDNARSISFP